MLQDINFLNALPKPKVIYPSILQSMLILGLVVIGMGGMTLWQRSTLSAQRSAILDADQRASVLEKKLASIGHHQHNGKLISRELIALLDDDFARQEIGFSQPMHQLTTRPNHGLWLTGFVIDQQEKNIQFFGKALSANRIYQFIDHLNDMPYFNGKVFNNLSILDGPVDSTSTDTGQSEAKQKAVLSFALQTNQVQSRKRTRR